MLRVSQGLRRFFIKQAGFDYLDSGELSPAVDLVSSTDNVDPEVARELFLDRLQELTSAHKHNTPMQNILARTLLGTLGGTIAAGTHHGYKKFIDPSTNVIPFGYGPLIGAGLGAGAGALEELLFEGPRRRNHKDMLELLIPASKLLVPDNDPKEG